MNNTSVGLGRSNSCALTLKYASVKANYSAIVTRVTTSYLGAPVSGVMMFDISASVSPCSSNSCTSTAACAANMTIVGTYRRLGGGVYGLNTRVVRMSREGISFSNSYMFCSRALRVDSKTSKGTTNRVASTRRNCDISVSTVDSRGTRGGISLRSVTLGDAFFGGVRLRIIGRRSSPVSPPPFVMNVTRMRISARANDISILSCITIISYNAPVGPGLTHMRARNNVTRKVNVTL